MESSHMLTGWTPLDGERGVFKSIDMDTGAEVMPVSCIEEQTESTGVRSIYEHVHVHGMQPCH